MRNFIRVLLLSMLGFPLLVVGDWSVAVDGVWGQAIDFSTGTGPGATMKVLIYDVCRVDAADRTYLGEFFPTSTVIGIDADATQVYNNPGAGNRIAFTMNNYINQTIMYTDNYDDTGTISFCAEVGLYDNDSLFNLAEVRVTYRLFTQTQEVVLESYDVTTAGGFTDAEDTNIYFDGILKVYFCDPYTAQELVDDGTRLRQGSILSLCFKVSDGQFEVADVKDLTVWNAISYDPSQDIILDSIIVADSVSTKTCVDNDGWDTNVCVVQFLLKGDFYQYDEFPLGGNGNVILEFGDATEDRLLIEDETESEKKYTTRPFQLKTQDFDISTDTKSVSYGQMGPEGSKIPSSQKKSNTSATDSRHSVGVILLAICVAATGLGILGGLCFMFSYLKQTSQCAKKTANDTKSLSTCSPSEPISTEFFEDEPSSSSHWEHSPDVRTMVHA